MKFGIQVKVGGNMYHFYTISLTGFPVKAPSTDSCLIMGYNLSNGNGRKWTHGVCRWKDDIFDCVCKKVSLISLNHLFYILF